jgi:WD40 repeat protein
MTTNHRKSCALTLAVLLSGWLMPAAGLFGQSPRERVALKASKSQIHGLAFAPDGKALAAASFDGTVRLFDLTTNQMQHAWSQKSIVCWRYVTFTADGKTLAAAGGQDDDNGAVVLWDVATGNGRVIYKGRKRLSAVALTRDGARLVAVGEEGLHRQWHTTTGADLAGFKPPMDGKYQDDICAVEFTADEKTLITGSWDSTARFWDAQTGKDIGAITHESSVWSLALSKDKKTIAVGCALGGIYQWDVATHAQRGNVLQHSRRVMALAYSPDGATLASASNDKTWKLWDTATSKERATVNELATSLTFSPDGKTLAVGHRTGVIKLWDVPAAAGKE